MSRNRRRSRMARAAVVGAAGLLALGLAACSTTTSAITPAAAAAAASASPSPTAAISPGGTATYALPQGVTLRYIFPFHPAVSESEYDTRGFQELMYRPLYYFGGNDNSVAVNYPLSTAHAPVYSDGGKTVTITMKGWKWSDGETVNAADLIFWLNMMKAEEAKFYGYTPGLIPDNLASYSATGPETVVLHLTAAVSQIWFTYDQLSELTPMPLAWDISKSGAAAGSGGCATDSAEDNWAKCVSVYRYLTGLDNSAGGYATSPTWAVVDGPWKLSKFSTDGYATFVPNQAYSGSPKPELDAVQLVPYTDGATEYTRLKAGAVDVGYVPPSDLGAVSGGQVLPTTDPLGSNYNLTPSYQYGIQYSLLNFNNPTYGPVFSQLYVRQALQEVMDQDGMIKAIDNGYGYPTSGAIPQRPTSLWTPAIQGENGGQGPYAFSIATAAGLLAAHGWSAIGGVQTCETPGTGATDCGANIAKGTKLSFTMDYAAGQRTSEYEASDYKSDAGQAGIKITLVPQSADAIVGETTPCSPGPNCDWDILNVGDWSYNVAGYEPTGEPLFETGAGSNSGSYSDPTENNLINLTHTSDSLSVFDQYATYTDQQLPFIWMPSAYAVQAVSSSLADVTFNPLGDFTPEYWYFTK
jgi:peptide/nickel transport system substrate-binding protein